MIGAIIARKSIAGAFRALNRHDLAGFMSNWADDACFIYPGDISESGTFIGRSEVERWFENFFIQFPRIEFSIRDISVRDIFATGGSNVVAVHWDLELTNRDGRKGENSGVTVITIRKGKVVQVKDYIFDLGEKFRLNWSAKSEGMNANR
ncbi:MAG: nuclear transport factor 2 family protein [Calditrichia bacterium]